MTQPPTPARHVGTPTPVFVDPTGRRRRLARVLGVGAVTLVVAWVGLLASALLGGPTIDAPFLPTPPLARPAGVAPRAPLATTPGRAPATTTHATSTTDVATPTTAVASRSLPTPVSTTAASASTTPRQTATVTAPGQTTTHTGPGRTNSPTARPSHTR